MKLNYSVIALLPILSLIECTQVPLINLHAALKDNEAKPYLRVASPESPEAMCDKDDSVFQLTYWKKAYSKNPEIYYVVFKDRAIHEVIKSSYVFSANASNNRQLTIKCIDTQTVDNYRLKIVSVDAQNEENLIMDQEMHSNSEIDLNPQPGKKYYITIYNIVNGTYILMKQYTVDIPHLKGAFYSGPTLYPVGKSYGKYALGWGMGISISPYATGTYNNYLFFPSVILFNNVFMVDSISTTNQNIFNFANIGIGISWLYGISGGIIIDLRKFEDPQVFFGFNVIQIVGYFL